MNQYIESFSEAAGALFPDTLKVKLGFGPRQRAEFYEMVANFVEDELPVFDALTEIHKQMKRERLPGAIVVADVLRSMRGSSGRAATVGQALGPWVDPVEAMTIDAGADAGKLVEGFRMAKRLCETNSRVRATIWGELLYPVALLVMFLGYLIVVGKVVLPVLSDVLKRELWPADAQVLGFLGDNAVVISASLGAMVLCVVSAFVFSRDRWVGSARDGFDRLVFPWSVACSVKGALLLSAISVMLKAGLPFQTILDQLGTTAGGWERYHFGRMRSALRAGRHEGEALASQMYSNKIRWQIELYGRTSNFAVAIDRLSHRVVEQVLAGVRRSFAIFRYIVMFLIAGMIVWTYGTFLSITMAARTAVGG